MTRLLVLLLVAGMAGCSGDDPVTGVLEMEWTGADTGRMSAPASARWCPSETAVAIESVRGDSGAAVALFTSDTIRPGVYPVGLPGGTPARPGARVAIRAFGENLILGFYSLSGTVTVDSAPTLSGTFQATLVGVNTGEQLNVNGRFRDLAVQAGEITCGARSRPTPADTGIR